VTPAFASITHITVATFLPWTLLVLKAARLDIPLLRPHRHPRIPSGLSPGTSGLLLQQRDRSRGRQGSVEPRTGKYRGWVEAFDRNHKIPMEWPKGVRTLRLGLHCAPV
jgi:hypothetical protein